MTGKFNLRLKPEEAFSKEKLEKAINEMVGGGINEYRIIRRSIDSRQWQIYVDMEIEVAAGTDGKLPSNEEDIKYQNVASAKPVIIVGAGPAGLFAALRCLEVGLKPIVIERGKPVEERIKDIAILQREGKLNKESNFCFGEGGAGAFSDGKLYTRSKKRGNVKDILVSLYKHGAKEEVLFESHPHIGSDRLPSIIKSIRETIIKKGGEIHFDTCLSSLCIEGNEVTGITTKDGKNFLGPVILATGHSARDVYKLLKKANIRLESKGFAMGVRLEHPQPVIDKMVYHNENGRGQFLPPAEYSVSCQVDGRGVYSFCMCPGGVIVPSMTEDGEVVVNGMSASARNGKWANSGIVVEIRPEDFPEYLKKGPLGLLELQKEVEKKFYEDNGSINVPAQRMRDFIDGKVSETLPKTSYVPGIHSSDIFKLFPVNIADKLQKGLKIIGNKNAGFLSNDAVLIGLESRTSSPVRIPRDRETLQHIDLIGLYPVGEGAGYAGGIVSSAIDGRNAVNSIYKNYVGGL